MERRWTARERARLNVDLHFKDYKVVNCVTRDISFGGLFLEIPHLRPDLGELVELVFKVRGREQMIYHRLPGKVVRAMEEGVGIMFRNFDAESFQALREIQRHKYDGELAAG